MKKIFILVTILLMFFVQNAIAVKTNINEVTDLFDRHIENKDALFKDLKEQNDNAIEQIGSKKSYDFIEGMEDASSKADELSSIKASELDNAGRKKRSSQEYRFYDENELEPNYQKSGNMAHKEDADNIAAKSGDILGSLLAKLKEIGIDCKTVKGPTEKEPTYYIDIEREEQKNTDYDQIFCEELRNQYNCIDSLSLTCRRKGFVKMERKQINLSYSEVQHLFKQDQWGRVTIFPEKMPAVARIIESKLSLPQKQIKIEMLEDQYIRFKRIRVLGMWLDHYLIGYTLDENAVIGSGDGSVHYQGGDAFCKWGRIGFHKPNTWDQKTVRFLYHTLEEVCEEWSEDWTERCNLR